MAQVRILRDGTQGVANTIYIPKDDDDKAAQIATQRNVKAVSRRKSSKSQVLVEAVKKGLPKCL